MTPTGTVQSAPTDTTHTYVQWLDAPLDLLALGGKAGPLARALAAGLPVPPGFVITPNSFRPHAAPTDDPLLPDATGEILRAYRDLGIRVGEPEPRVAVRSSATAEDLAGASFAGQYDTFLHVRGASELLTYTARCWASLWSENAAAYREHYQSRSGTTLPPPQMAVLVQPLIDADAAGVAFTAHPTSGDRSRILINAGWGLGQSIVDGEVEADTWLLDRESLGVLEHTVGFKPEKRAVAPTTPTTPSTPTNGTTPTISGGEAFRTPVPDHLQHAPCLTPAQAAAVAALALRAEAITGGPSDVEWAFSGTTLWLLQARPITTLPIATPTETTGEHPASAQPSVVGPTPDFPFDWPSPESRLVNWQLRSIDQRRPEVLRPLEQDVRLVWYRTFERAAVVCGRPRYRLPLYLNGYEYVGEVASPQSEADQALRRDAFEQVGAALAERGETYRRVVQFPPIDAGNARLAAVDLDALSPDELAAHLQDAIDWYERLWTEHWTGPQDSPMARFTTFYKQHLVPPPDTAAAAAAAGGGASDPPKADDAIDEEIRALLVYEPNLLTDAIDGLIDLARTAQSEPALRNLFLATSHTAEAVLDALPDTPGGHAFRAQLDALLETQGLRSGAGFGTERSQVLPGWGEQPALVVELVRKYVPQDLDALLRARHAALAERDRRVAELRAQLPDETTRTRFDFWLTAARAQQTAFEDHNLKIDSASSALLHRAIAATARRLVDGAILPAPDDVWWLRLHELPLALQALPQPRTAAAATTSIEISHEPSHWSALLAARRSHHAWCARLTPPPSLGSLSAPPPPTPGFAAGGRPPVQSGASSDRSSAAPPNLLVKGSPGSRGIATGTVRLVSHEDLVPAVAEGDVLVARNAGPLWTPIFPIVAAVVLDQGVLFQHAMLTCREYGVPAVFQTKDATLRLTEGQRVTVDGENGWIFPAAP